MPAFSVEVCNFTGETVSMTMMSSSQQNTNMTINNILPYTPQHTNTQVNVNVDYQYDTFIFIGKKYYAKTDFNQLNAASTTTYTSNQWNYTLVLGLEGGFFVDANGNNMSSVAKSYVDNDICSFGNVVCGYVYLKEYPKWLITLIKDPSAIQSDIRQVLMLIFIVIVVVILGVAAIIIKKTYDHFKIGRS